MPVSVAGACWQENTHYKLQWSKYCRFIGHNWPCWCSQKRSCWLHCHEARTYTTGILPFVYWPVCSFCLVDFRITILYFPSVLWRC